MTSEAPSPRLAWWASWLLLVSAAGCVGGTVFPLSLGEEAGAGGQGGAGGAGGAAGATAAPVCEGLLTPNDCARCVEKACCDSLQACSEEERCVACINGSTSPLCAENERFLAFRSCIEEGCKEVCQESESRLCNPVTNEGCSGGEACDYGEGGFACYPPPNDAPLCAPCDPGAGVTCAGGMGCVDYVCMKYCCNHGDCGEGFCDQRALASKTLGVCLSELMQGEVAVLKPMCQVPPEPPSGGSCFTEFGKEKPEPDCLAPLNVPSFGECAPQKLGCNPVISGGCKMGESCDRSATGYACYSSVNIESVCDACDANKNLNCRPGHTCLSGKCARYCCDDGDCSQDGSCQYKDEFGIGVCARKKP